MSVRAMKAGAVEFLTKPFRKQPNCSTLSRRLCSAMARSASKDRRPWNSEIGSRRSLRGSVRSWRWLLPACLNKQIAGELGTTDLTIKVHRGRVMRKMGAGSLADLVRMAEKLKISSEPGVRPK